MPFSPSVESERSEGSESGAWHAHQKGFHCLNTGLARICRRYCTVGQASGCTAGQSCVQLSGAATGVGACQ